MPRSIPSLFREQAQKLGSRPMVYSKVHGHWTPLTWFQVGQRVDEAAAGLVALGLLPGENVTLLSEDRVEWLLAELSILSTGAADAPIDPTSSAAEVASVVRASASRFAFVSGQEQLDKLMLERADLPGLEHVVTFEERVDVPPNVEAGITFSVLSFSALEALGRQGSQVETLGLRVARIEPTDPLTVGHHSVLTHGQVISSCEAIRRAMTLNSDDSIISSLPMVDSFGRLAGLYLPLLFVGAQVYFAESLPRFLHNLREVRPTVLVSTPRFYEDVYARFMDRRAEATGTSRLLIDWALRVGLKHGRERQAGRAPSLILQTQYTLAFKLLLSKIGDEFGGRIRLLVCEGAPLSVNVVELLNAAGLLVCAELNARQERELK